MAARKPRPAPRARHQDTRFRSIPERRGPLHDDTWQRQADAAAWAAVSGMPAERYLGWLEPIPVPDDLRAKLRAAGEAMAAMPSQERLTALLTLAHEAAYGRPPREGEIPPPRAMALEASRKPLQTDGEPEWWDTSGADRKAASDALTRFAEEAGAALAASDWQPEDGGEVARGEPAREWWE